MKKKYFGTDGIRGRVNKNKINGEMFLNLDLQQEHILKIKKKLNKQQLLLKIQDYQDILLNQLLFLD